MRGRQNLVREVGADFVLRDNLRRDAQNVRRRAIVFCERDAIRRRVASSLPAGKPLEEKFEAPKRRAAETVNSLIVVADGDDVARLGGEQMK